jgi:hypothetical protein
LAPTPPQDHIRVPSAPSSVPSPAPGLDTNGPRRSTRLRAGRQLLDVMLPSKST